MSRVSPTASRKRRRRRHRSWRARRDAAVAGELWRAVIRRAKHAADLEDAPPCDAFDASAAELEVDWEGLRLAGVPLEGAPSAAAARWSWSTIAPRSASLPAGTARGGGAASPSGREACRAGSRRPWCWRFSRNPETTETTETTENALYLSCPDPRTRRGLDEGADRASAARRQMRRARRCGGEAREVAVGDSRWGQARPWPCDTTRATGRSPRRRSGSARAGSWRSTRTRGTPPCWRAHAAEIVLKAFCKFT